MSLEPFDLTGGPFLMLYGFLFVLTVVAGIAVPRWLQPEGRSPSPPGLADDPDRMAMLTGGKDRFGEAVVARLLDAGALAVEKRKSLTVRERQAGRTPAERAVLALPQPVSWSDVSKALAENAEAVESGLIRDGLLIDRAIGWQMRFCQVMPYLALLLFGAVKWEIGSLRDKPVGWLTGFLIVTLIFAVIRFVALDRRTRCGVEAERQARLRHDRIRRAPTRDDVGLAVAIYGTAVLAGSPLSDFHALRSSSSSSSSSDSGSSDSGGGCGGGGCGGCGG